MKFKLGDKVRIVTDCLRFSDDAFTYGYICAISSRHYKVRALSETSYCWANEGEIELYNSEGRIAGLSEGEGWGTYEEIIVPVDYEEL